MAETGWAPSASLETLRRRADMRRRLRRWFDEHGVLEVETSLLCRHPVSDVQIESVAAQLALDATTRYLHTSPEYQMKRLLAAGAPDIYQIVPVFRDGERGSRHQPEFTLIEWYRHGYGLDAMIDETLALLRELLGDAAGPRPLRRHYGQCFRERFDIDPSQVPTERLAALAAAEGAPSGLTRDGLLDWLLVTAIVPSFERGRLTVLTHFPASQAALARLDPERPTEALRFEIFAGDLELANGFVELADANEQRARFEADLAGRRLDGRPDVAIDPQFLAALAHGLPDCAGVAVGLDRLVMLAAGIDDIRAVQAFPVCP